MKEINKIICIGANCISLDFSKTLGIREKGPVDNFAGFNIWNSPLLFNNEFKKIMFKDNYTVRQATPFELQKYFFNERIFVFEKGFSIVHNNFESLRFRYGLKKRIWNFHKYYKASQIDESLWYVYSLDYLDINLTENNLYKIKSSLPKNVVSHLICLGIRARNPLFKKYFNYYIEFENEQAYLWGDKMQAIKIANLLEKKYQIKINYESEETI